MIVGNKAYCNHYITPFKQLGSSHMMTNVETVVDSIEWKGIDYPTTLNDTNYRSSYVCSPYNALVSYSFEEIAKIPSKLLRLLLKSMVFLQAGLLKLGSINKNYAVNNYLLSTNLYPAETIEGLGELTHRLIEKNPTHALHFRSLNYHSNKALLDQFWSCGYLLFPSRQVYLFDKNLSDYTQSNNFKNDGRLLNKSTLTAIRHQDIKETDYARIVDLYNALYLEKYSKHNPQFGKALIQYWHENHLLTYIGLRNSKGVLDGIVGLFENNKYVTAPLVGYDTSFPQETGLYRAVIHLIMNYTLAHNKVLNLSSGASHFKMLRRGQPYIEYSAVYIKHLSWGRRLLWRVIKLVLDKIFVPILKKYKL